MQHFAFRYICVLIKTITNNYKRFKKLSIMTTYFIDYIYANTLGANFYYQLVRRADGAILYANPKLENVQIECWKRCISVNDVEIL